MGEAIGQVLTFGVAVALSPISIIGVVLMLGTPRARANGPAFIAGWIVGVLGLGAIVLAASHGADASDGAEPADWVGAVQIALGTLLLLVAVNQSRSVAEPRTPKWMQTIDSFTAPRAAAFAIAFSAINPKNLLLVVGAATAIAQTGASTGNQIAALVVFAAIATVGVGAPVVIYFAMGERSKQLLDDLKRWMSTNNAAIIAVICLLMAAKLVDDGISNLSG